MVELFDLQRTHNGIGVQSRAHPRLIYEFRMGGGCVVNWMGGERDMCISTDGYQVYPPTDKAITCAVMANANERAFIKTVGIEYYVPEPAQRYIRDFMIEPILEIKRYEPARNIPQIGVDYEIVPD